MRAVRKKGIILRELIQLVKQLKDDGMDEWEIASAFNISPETVCRLQLTKVKKISMHDKIDKKQFIKMWKNGVPYEVIAKKFDVSYDAITQFKSKECRDIVRNAICYSCGTGFETTDTRAGLCESCKFEHHISWFNRLNWKKKLEEGTMMIEEKKKKHLEEEERELLRKLRKKEKKEEEKPWWWEN